MQRIGGCTISRKRRRTRSLDRLPTFFETVIRDARTAVGPLRACSTNAAAGLYPVAAVESPLVANRFHLKQCARLWIRRRRKAACARASMGTTGGRKVLSARRSRGRKRLSA